MRTFSERLLFVEFTSSFMGEYHQNTAGVSSNICIVFKDTQAGS